MANTNRPVGERNPETPGKLVEKFPGLDAIRNREKKGTLGGTPRRERTEAELAALPPSHRDRALHGQGTNVMREGGVLSNARTRGTKLTPALVDEIVRFLATGAPLTYVAQAVAVSDLTIRTWMQRGERVLARDTDPRATLPDHELDEGELALDRLTAQLVTEVGRARGRALVSSVGTVKQGRKGWQGSAWLLERLDRKRWAPPALRVEHDGVLFDEHGRLTEHGEAFAAKLGEATTAALIEARVPREVGARFIAAFGGQLEQLFRFGESVSRPTESEDSEAARTRAETPNDEDEHDADVIGKPDDDLGS